jgi:Arc/MetJ-type ribon-helix-helix transcriptional regulator
MNFLSYQLAHGIIKNMNTLTIKIPEALEQDLIRLSKQAHISKSELVRQALQAFLARSQSASPFVSALDQAGDLVGCFSGGPTDLSTNPEYLNGFGSV